MEVSAIRSRRPAYHDDKLAQMSQKIVIKTTDVLFFGEKKACIVQALHTSIRIF